jgi:hypothetical protein
MSKRKGTRNEHRSMRWLEAQGYYCTRSGGSLGVWDIIAISDAHVLLVQVKTNAWPRPAERKTMAEFVRPGNCDYETHRWNDYAKTPEVRVCDDYGLRKKR